MLANNILRSNGICRQMSRLYRNDSNRVIRAQKEKFSVLLQSMKGLNQLG